MVGVLSIPFKRLPVDLYVGYLPVAYANSGKL